MTIIMSDHQPTFVSVYEDTVHVSFFSLELDSSIKAWEELCSSINETVQKLTNNYIWHKDEFKVYTSRSDDKTDIPTHLESTTCFGDNIEDEWYIVYLVKEISKQYEHLIIQIEDNDGEFLLIEAANYLPTWAKPDNTTNRVFLHNQHIHMIPPTVTDLKTNLKLIDAVKLVSCQPEITRASMEIEKAIFSRVDEYPQKVIENFHHAIVKLPIEIAALLTIKPSLISPIVDAYCNHDMIDLKSCPNIEYKNTVMVKVKFTKCLYAMLIHARLVKNIKNKVLESNKHDILGVKVTFGFNIINKRIKEDVFSTKEFSKYIDNLKQSGYFQQNIENSKEYNILMEKAQKYFVDTKSPLSSYLSSTIAKVMNSDQFIQISETLRQKDSISELDEDNDDWLNIHPNQLNELLSKKYQQVNFNKDEGVTPHQITSTLTNFLKQTSDFEGIDVHASSELNTEDIDFDPDEFVNCLDKMMNLLITDANGVEMTDNSDYDFGSDKTDDEVDTLEEELSSKLSSESNDRKSSKTIMSNLVQSIKEEDITGPTSNLLKSVGINKSDLLDSDDD